MTPIARDRLVRFLAGTFVALFVFAAVVRLDGPGWAAVAFAVIAYTVVIQSGARRP